jgi:hypothetical protein
MTTNRTIARQEVNTHPTEAQCKAGNYKMGHLLVNGFDITIENPKGSYRCGKDRNGKSWKCLMHNDYGYFRKTVGKDGDAVDVFLGPNLNSRKIFPIDQFINGKFDETKVMMGFDSKEEAKAAYLSNYSADWKGFKYITEVDVDTFAKWLYDGHRQRKPFAKYMWLKEDKINLKSIINEETGKEVIQDAWEDNMVWETLEEFESDRGDGITKKRWHLIPANQYYNLINRFMAKGSVANIPINVVTSWFMQIIVPNAFSINNITELAGHTAGFPYDDFVDMYGEEWEGKEFEDICEFLDKRGFYDWACLPDGSDGWSDYGLEPIFRLIGEYDSNMTGEELLVLINKILDVAHCRGDLASAFIEGGSRALSQVSSGRMVSEGKRLENDPNRKNKGVAKTPLKAIKAANRAEEIKAHGRSTALRSMVISKDKTKYNRNAFKKNNDFLNENKTPIYKLTIDFSGYYNEKKGTFSDTAVAEILDYIKEHKVSDALVRMDFYKKDKSDFEEYDIFCKKLQIKTLEYEVADSDRKVYRANITCDDQSATALIKLFVNLGAIGNGGHSFELSIDKESFYFDGDGADRVDAVNGVKLRGKVLDNPHEWYEIKKKGEPQKEEEESIDNKLREMIREAILRELR